MLPRYIVCGRYFAPTSSTHISLTGMTLMTVKDKEGHRALILIPSDGRIPESLLSCEIPHDRVMNVREFDDIIAYCDEERIGTTTHHRVGF